MMIYSIRDSKWGTNSKQILYTSVETNTLADPDPMDILDQARSNNARDNVTGMLIYSGGQFLQALEGDASDVDAIFSRIAVDPRHRDVHMFLDHNIPSRTFSDWSMGFAITDLAEINVRTGAVSLNNLADIYRHVSDELVLELMIGFVKPD